MQKKNNSFQNQTWIETILRYLLHYHPLQNHYTHEIIIFELFRDYSYSFQGLSN